MTDRARQVTTLLTVRLVGVGLQIAVQLLVGRLAGPAGLGLLQLFTSWTCVLGEAAATGRPTLSMRALAVARDRASPPALDTYLSSQVRGIGFPWLAALLVSLPIALHAGDKGTLVFLAILSAGSFALLRLFADGLKALGSPNAGVLIENCVPAATLLVLCAGLWLAGSGLPEYALPVALTLGFFLSMLLTTGLLAARVASGSGVKPVVPAANWEDLLPLWGTGLLSILFLQLPFLWLPLYSDAATLGQFALAYKLVNLVSTVLLLLAALYGPRFARAWSESPGELPGLLWESQLSALCLYLPPALVLLAGGGTVLALFGEGFRAGQSFLFILLAGQFVNALTGLPGLLLNMAGAGRQEFSCLLVTMALACAGFLLFGPRLGAEGVALVYSAALAFKNLVSWWLAWRLAHGHAAVGLEATA